MRFLKKILYYSIIITFTAAASIYISKNFIFNKSSSHQHKPYNMNIWIKDVLKLSLVEIQVSQIHSFASEGIKVYNFSLPFTKQQSLIVTQGKVSLGYDLNKVSITETSSNYELILPEITVQSVDLDFNIMSEQDSLLNRITPDMRNKMMGDIKKQVTNSVLNNYADKVKSKNEVILKLLQKVSSKKVVIKK